MEFGFIHTRSKEPIWMGLMISIRTVFAIRYYMYTNYGHKTWGEKGSMYLGKRK